MDARGVAREMALWLPQSSSNARKVRRPEAAERSTSTMIRLLREETRWPIFFRTHRLMCLYIRHPLRAWWQLSCLWACHYRSLRFLTDVVTRVLLPLSLISPDPQKIDSFLALPQIKFLTTELSSPSLRVGYLGMENRLRHPRAAFISVTCLPHISNDHNLLEVQSANVRGRRVTGEISGLWRFIIKPCQHRSRQGVSACAFPILDCHLLLLSYSS